MKTRVLLLGAAITAFTFSTFASDALLSPRATDNQPKYVASSANDPDLLAASRSTLLSPRAYGNQIKTVAGVANDSNLALVCAKNMNGSPKMISECSSHTTMPGCVTVAALK
ncbi:MAG TPA: hypothetical protein VNN22_11900 [Verrucomicrobiae bacterium]|nr:hypothetical protein [Verrucomicrobiae bacterium]